MRVSRKEKRAKYSPSEARDELGLLLEQEVTIRVRPKVKPFVETFEEKLAAAEVKD